LETLLLFEFLRFCYPSAF